MDEILNIVRGSLLAVKNPRFYESERGFQAELLSEIRQRIPALELEGAVVEQEYQKRMRDHGFRIRPDIIIHVPFDATHHHSRREGNFVVIELKFRATQRSAFSDYENLSRMCEELDYPLGIFINISSNLTFLEQFEGEGKEKLRAFAVSLNGDQVVLQE